MEPADPRAIVQQVYAAINAGDLDAARRLLAPDLVEHEAIGESRRGPDAFLWFIQTFRAAFPDLQVTPEDVIVEGGRVAVRSTLTGTHRGELMGLPGSGRHVRIGGIDVMRIADGKVLEHWGLADSLSLLQQIGMTPGVE